MENEYKIRFSAEAKKDFIAKIKGNELFYFYRRLNKDIEESLLLMEIEELLDKEFTLFDLAEIQALDETCIELYDFKEQAKLCLQIILKDMVQMNRDRLKSMKNKDSLFDETLEVTKAEIIRYIQKERDDFPMDALQCLYLLPEDEDQLKLTAFYLMRDCMAYCKDVEIVRELTYKIFEGIYEDEDS